MKLEQHIVFKDYCVICGEPTKKEACSEDCEDRLEKLRFHIKDQIENEKGGVRIHNTQWLKGFNKVQELIDNSNTN